MQKDEIVAREKVNKSIEDILRNKVGEAIGEASMCWSTVPTGIYDSTRAKRIWEELLAEIVLYRISFNGLTLSDERLRQIDHLQSDLQKSQERIRKYQKEASYLNSKIKNAAEKNDKLSKDNAETAVFLIKAERERDQLKLDLQKAREALEIIASGDENIAREYLKKRSE